MSRKKHTPQQIIGMLREETQMRVENLRQHDNTIWPHSAPGYEPPALGVVAPRRADPAFANQGRQPVQPVPQTAFAAT